MFRKAKTMAKRLMPGSLARRYQMTSVARLREANRIKSVKDVFTEIYQSNMWGGAPGEFCSGSGSSGIHASQYAEVVRTFIQETNVKTVVDLGCGDFVVGKLLQMDGVRYFGVDIVEELILRNNDKFASQTTSFICLDITSGDLPDADLCLIRQVLQHLSNDQIEHVLEKVSKYRWVIVTEHYPSPKFKVTPNLDKPHGSDTRVYDNSGVYLDAPPFNITNARPILEVDAGNYMVSPGEQLRSFLIEKISE